MRALDDLRNADDPLTVRKARTAAQRELWRDRRDDELRLTLAEHYRARGVGSQAGRWGIATDGWAQPHEVHELRHWLLGVYRHNDYLRELLFLPADRPLPAEVADLIDPSWRAPSDVPPRPGFGGCGWFAVAFLSSVVVAICGVTMTLKAFNADPDLFTAAREMLALGAPAGAVGIGAFFIGRWADRRSDRRAGRDSTREEDHDPDFAMQLASRLAEAGDRRAGEILLRACVRSDNDVNARRSLMQWAREAARPDQAGRWGAPIDGATTAREREAFAACLRELEPQKRVARVRDLCVTWTVTSRDMRDILRRAGGVTATDDEAVEEGADKPVETPVRDLHPAWWLAPIALGVVGCMATGALAVLADSTAVLAARWTVATTLIGFGGLRFLGSLWERPRERWLRWSGATFGAGVIALGGWCGWMLLTDSWGG